METVEALKALSGTKRLMVSFIVRYGMLLIPLFWDWKLASTVSQDAVRKAAYSLVEDELLVPHPFPAGRQSYFVLSAKTIYALNLKRSTRPFSHEVLFRIYATQLFGYRHNVELITPGEFLQKAPDYCTTANGQCIDRRSYFSEQRDGSDRIGCLIVDSHRQVGRLVAKVNQALRIRMANPAFRADMEAGQFYVAVATTSERRKAQILAELPPQRGRAVPVCIEVEAFEAELAPFLLARPAQRKYREEASENRPA